MAAEYKAHFRAEFAKTEKIRASEYYGQRRCLRRRAFMDKLLAPFRHCAICGAPGVLLDLLCGFCEEKVSRIQNRGAAILRDDYPFPVYSLLTWNRNSDSWIRPLAYALKGGNQVKGINALLADLSYERRLLDPVLDPVFIPPPRDFKKLDHGWLMAALLSELWQGECWDGLEKVASEQGSGGVSNFVNLAFGSFFRDVVKGQNGSRSRQKQLTREDRAQLRFCVRKGMYDLHGGVRAIFTDDIITTGSTAMAAYMSLGEPDWFEAWTLIHRPRDQAFPNP